MATATRETKITITLAMNKIEAEFIRDLTQNNLIDAPGDESVDRQIARKSIFAVVDKQLRKRK